MESVNRRTVLTALSSVGVVGISGCLGSDDTQGSADDCTIEHSTNSVDVSFGADGTMDDADAILDLRWNAWTQSSIEGIITEEDEHVIIYYVAMSNQTDEAVPTGGWNFSLTYETPNIRDSSTFIYQVSSPIDEVIEESVEILPEGELNVAIPFTAPTETTNATLEANDYDEHDVGERDSAIGFEPNCDESLEITVPE